MFRDRIEAGKRLAEQLGHLRDQDVVVLGLPRGGVPVAVEVASALEAPLDVIVVRKLGVPFQPELAMGAIGEQGAYVLNEQVMHVVDVSDDEVSAIASRERAELERRVQRYRSGRPPVGLAGRTAVIVDDGVATGSTAEAACRVVRSMGADRVVLAVPVAPADWVDRLGPSADELVSVETHEHFLAVGHWYRDFTQVSDDDVVRLLAAAHERAAGQSDGPDCVPAIDRSVDIPIDGIMLPGHLVVPEGAVGVVVFAHGSGSSRHSPRNRWVAARLNERGLGTLLFDLLTPREELDRSSVFDVELLGNRLHDVVRFVESSAELSELPVGLFGASTGAAAALGEASRPDSQVAAVVSRGGRPDLAMDRLASVRAPTRLIVGGHDELVLELNREAAARLRCEHDIAIVAGATHLFAEEGALEQVAQLAAEWFLSHR